MKTTGYAAQTATSPLAPYEFERRSLRPNDVALEVLYCGVCHSDLHWVKDEWGSSAFPTVFPTVVGHEIVGRAIEVASDVTRHQLGDIVAIGCMVDSCQHCDQCQKGDEQLCREGPVYTYGGLDRETGEPTKGGYAKHIVCSQDFVLKMPEGLDVAKAAPLLCAGITTFSPLRTWGIGPGSRIAVVGMGGLGHMAIKLASAMGAHVTVLSRTADKEPDATALGADAFLLSSDEAAMAAAASNFALIIDTIPVEHDVNPYLPLLDVDGTLCIVGQLGPMTGFTTAPLLAGRRRIAGSPIGGITETQEMLDFCARMNILPEVEMIGIHEINAAFERMERSDVRYRFVIDMASLDLPQNG